MLQWLSLISAACMCGRNGRMHVVALTEYPGSQREHVAALITSDVVCTSCARLPVSGLKASTKYHDNRLVLLLVSLGIHRGTAVQQAQCPTVTHTLTQ